MWTHNSQNQCHVRPTFEFHLKVTIRTWAKSANGKWFMWNWDFEMWTLEAWNGVWWNEVWLYLEVCFPNHSAASLQPLSYKCPRSAKLNNFLLILPDLLHNVWLGCNILPCHFNKMDKTWASTGLDLGFCDGTDYTVLYSAPKTKHLVAFRKSECIFLHWCFKILMPTSFLTTKLPNKWLSVLELSLKRPNVHLFVKRLLFAVV